MTRLNATARSPFNLRRAGKGFFPRWAAAAILLNLAALMARAASASSPEAEKKVSPWESTIQSFEKEDAVHPPPKGAILFVGSSSIRFWDVAKSFPDLTVINRGFGGSTAADAVQFVDRIVIPYKPRTVVFYSGDNDLASGKSPEEVFGDFKAFERAVHAKLPETRLIILSIKPSPSRWALVEKMRETNKMIADYCAECAARETKETGGALTEFMDVHAPLLGKDGLPRDELFKPDKLHLNDEGYKIWTEILRPRLGKADPH
ncbi:hypothetical protein HYR69_01765 [Candidatus Sumerlaeota bacterium]|nr:hypothetical protein [Candidatus Sumerlaeota bacterium]MBI3736933.1 hypothetical protein [Candidatus Sumerlaeota bacterium]